MFFSFLVFPIKSNMDEYFRGFLSRLSKRLALVDDWLCNFRGKICYREEVDWIERKKEERKMGERKKEQEGVKQKKTFSKDRQRNSMKYFSTMSRFVCF